MDLKKLFVYVPSASEDTFIANVINTDEAAKYANKIVFLEKTLRIWAKGQYYGSNPADVAAVWTALGIGAGTKPSGNYAVGEQTFSYSNFAEWIGALKEYSDAKIAAEKAEVVASYKAADSAIITAYQKADTAIITAYQKADTAIITSYKAADSAIITAYQKADTAIITAYQKADTDLNNAYTAFKDKVGNIDGLTGTLMSYIAEQDASARTEVKVSGSGLDIQKKQGTDGHDIYTITADQSIWEFCGTYDSIDASYVSSDLNSQYGTEEGAKRLHAEVGDVWAVTLTNSGTTVLYACSEHTDGDPDINVWVPIGAAEGIVDVDTSEEHGIALYKSGGIVGVSVTPGAIAENDGSVITGGTAYTAIKAAQDNAYAYTSSVGQDIITGYQAAVQEAKSSLSSSFGEAIGKVASTAGQAMSKAEQAYAYANTRANEAQANAYDYADTRANEAQANAYAKIESAINALDAAYSGTLAASYNGTNYTYLSYNVVQTDGALNTAYITMDVNAIQNYVLDTMWETYSA